MPQQPASTRTRRTAAARAPHRPTPVSTLAAVVAVLVGAAIAVPGVAATADPRPARTVPAVSPVAHP